MSVMREPWVQPGLNYSDVHHLEDFCKQDGGSWNVTGKWCTPIPPATLEQLIGNATEHRHNYISYNSGVKSLPGKFAALVLMLSILMTFATAAVVSPIERGLLLERATNGTYSPQAQPCVKRAVKVGDGNPHKSCRWRQVTGNLDCKGGTCSVSHLESRSLSWSIGFGGNGGEYTTAGFDVSESYTTGNTYSCGGDPGQTVCVTALVGYTDYTVQERVSSGECTYVHSDPYVIYAPNNNHQQYYRCHHNSNCHYLDWEKWDHNDKSCRND